AHAPPAPPPRPVEAVAEEPPPPPPAPERWVRVVTHRPVHGRFVGRVRATALDEDFVTAAKEARAQLRRRVEALGGNVVRLDRVEPDRRGGVVLVGRAYKLAN